MEELATHFPKTATDTSDASLKFDKPGAGKLTAGKCQENGKSSGKGAGGAEEEGGT